MMSKLLRARVVGCGAGLALWAAGVGATTTPDQPANEDVLARFNGGQITVADLKAAIANKDPGTRRRLATPEGRVGLLRELENYDLLVLEAERRGYAKHPAVIDARRRAAVDTMLADSRVDPASIPAAEVARELATRRARTARPAKRPSAVEGALREQLAKERFEQVRDELVKRLYEQYQPEIHAELIDAVTLGPTDPPDQPHGFAAAPPDPRSAARTVESDGF